MKIIHTFLILSASILFIILLSNGAYSSESNFQPSLASYNISPTEAAPGDYINCRFDFINDGQAPSIANERIFLHFTVPQNPSLILWQADHDPLVSTQFWMPNQTIEDGPLPVLVPQDIKDGTYCVRVGLWNPATNLRSLEAIPSVTLTINRNIKSLAQQSIPSIPVDTANRKNKSLLLQRFLAGSQVQLESDNLLFQIKLKEGLFCIQNKGSGAVWQSSPSANGLGFVSAKKNNKPFRIPLNDLKVLSESSKQCRLQKEINGSVIIEIEFQLNAKQQCLNVSWKTGADWQFYKIEWDSLLWTTDSLGIGAVIPRLMGEMFPANSVIEYTKTFGTYAGWGGLHIPMTGMMNKNGSALLSWQSPNISVQLKSVLVDQNIWPGSKNQSISLHSEEPQGEFSLSIIDGHRYVDLARAYRNIADKNGILAGLENKARRNREVKKLFGAAEFKPFVCFRDIRNQNGAQSERIYNNYTEEDCIQIARHLHDDLQLTKVLFVLAGWIHRGYDNQHPDILPAAPEIGGDQGVARISESVRSYGYLFGLHDNYQDMYTDAPSWDQSMIMMEQSGQRKKGGVWAGGQSWLIASNYGLQLAQRNLPEVKRLYAPNAYFIDTTYAAPLYESFDPQNPLTRIEDMRYKKELSRYAAQTFGVHGSETGFAFGVPESHYFEGILSGAPIVKDFPHPAAQDIPLFPLIFHDCIAMYTHQGDRAGINDARKILKHLVLGEMPLYDIAPHQYWKQDMTEPDLTKAENCFARFNQGWGEGKHPTDRFIKNTYEFLSPFAEGVAALPMTEHRYLNDDRSVERSKFGQHWQVIVNYGPEDYRYGETMLPPMGFVAVGPDYLAQHFYPKFGEEATSLIVQRGETTYIGFK